MTLQPMHTLCAHATFAHVHTEGVQRCARVHVCKGVQRSAMVCNGVQRLHVHVCTRNRNL